MNWNLEVNIHYLYYSSAYTLLKGFDKKGRRVFLFRLKNFNPDKYKVDDMYRLHFMIMEILIDGMDQRSVTGFVTISDAKNATMSHVTAFSNPVTMKKSTTVFQGNMN